MKRIISAVFLISFLLWGGAFSLITNSSSLPGSLHTSAAQTEDDFVPCELKDCTLCHLLMMVEKIFKWLLGLAFAVAVLFVIISGFLYIVSVGDEGLMGSAKEGLKYSIIGFVICLCSWLAIHVLFTVLDFKKKGDWWTIECSEGAAATPASDIRKIALKAANEVNPVRLGGRENPVSLANLIDGQIDEIPEDKYFFIHGIGGQPIAAAGEKLAELVKLAKEEGKELYAAIPIDDQEGSEVGMKLISLNDYLGGTGELSSEDREQFSDLAVFLLSNNVAELTTMSLVTEGESPPEFSGIWPEFDWEARGEDIEPFKTEDSLGLVYEEGDGPILFNSDKFTVPFDQTHIQINLKEDGTLDEENPFEIVNVAEGVTEEQLEEYKKQLKDLVFTLNDQLKANGKEDEFITELLKQLSKRERDYLNRIKREDEDKEEVEEEYVKWGENEDLGSGESNPEEDRKKDTGGTGTLPSKIKNKGTGSGSGTGTGDTGNTGSTCSNCGNTGIGQDGKINESITSVGIGGDLTEEEKRNLYEKIIPRALEEMGLDVDPKLIMCLIKQESGFNTGATSSANAKGLTQIIPGTAPIAQRDFRTYSERYRNSTGKDSFYHELKKRGITDSMMKSPQALYSQLDEAGKKGALSVNLGIAYLREIKDRKGLNLNTREGVYALLNGYYGGPGRAYPTRTGYSGTITHCLDAPGMRHLIYPGRSEKKK